MPASGPVWSVFSGFARMALRKNAIRRARDGAQPRAFRMASDGQERVDAVASSCAIRSEQIAWTARPSSSTQLPSQVSSSSVMR